jgi:hypothetical protein
MCRIAAAWEFNARVLTEHHVTKMYEFQVCHWQEHRSQTLRGVVLQKNNRGKNGKTKNGSVKKLPHHPVLFSCLNSQLKNSNPHQTYPCIRGKTKPRCRESLGFGYCENPQIAGFTLSWSSTDPERERERERERDTHTHTHALWALLLFAPDSRALKSGFRSLSSQKFSVPVSSFFLDFCVHRVFSCLLSRFLVASSSLLSVG